MAVEQVLRIPAELERLDEVIDFVGTLLDDSGCAPQVRTQAFGRCYEL